MKRLLVVARAPSYIPDESVDGTGGAVSFTINSVMKNTTTARVNRIFSASGVSSGL